MPTGQLVDSAAPVAELLRLVRDAPMPAEPPAGRRDVRELPGGVSNTTHGEGVVRGVGYAVGIKNVGFSEGFDDYSTARVRLELAGGAPWCLGAHRRRRGRPGPGDAAAADRAHRARGRAGDGAAGRHQHRLGRLDVGVAAVLRHRRRGAGGLPGGRWPSCSSASARPAYRPRTCCSRTAWCWGPPARGSRLSPTCWATSRSSGPCSGGTGRPPRSTRVTGQGNAHVQFAFAAHRAVVDVDIELGLVKVVEIAPRRTSARR